MKLIFIYGPPAAGKLTISRELEKLTGFPVFHNSLTIDLINQFLPFPKKETGKLIGDMRIAILDRAAKEKRRRGIIMTFVEANGDEGYIRRLERTMKKNHGAMYFIELHAPLATLEKRVGNASRRKHTKIHTKQALRKLHREYTFNTLPHTKHTLSIDTSAVQPKQAAKMIRDRFRLPRKGARSHGA